MNIENIRRRIKVFSALADQCKKKLNTAQSKLKNEELWLIKAMTGIGKGTLVIYQMHVYIVTKIEPWSDESGWVYGRKLLKDGVSWGKLEQSLTLVESLKVHKDT